MNLLELQNGAEVNIIVQSLSYSLWQAFILYLTVKFVAMIVKSSKAKYWIAQSAMVFLLLSLAGTSCYLKNEPSYSGLPANTIVVDQQLTYNNILQGKESLLDSLENKTTQFISNNYMLLFRLWLLGLTVLLIKKFFSVTIFGVIKNRYSYSAPDNIIQILNRVKLKLGIRQDIVLLVSEKVTSPNISGLLKPVIILPVSLITSVPYVYIEAALTHELIHYRNLDLFARVIQNIVEVIFFFNPFVHMISNIVDLERENACDDETLLYTGKVNYVKTLAFFAENTTSEYSFGINLLSNKHKTLNRLTRIVGGNMNNKHSNLKAAFIAVFIALSFGFMHYSMPVEVSDNNNSSTRVGDVDKKNSKLNFLGTLTPIEVEYLNAYEKNRSKFTSYLFEIGVLNSESLSWGFAEDGIWISNNKPTVTQQQEISDKFTKIFGYEPLSEKHTGQKAKYQELMLKTRATFSFEKDGNKYITALYGGEILWIKKNGERYPKSDWTETTDKYFHYIKTIGEKVAEANSSKLDGKISRSKGKTSKLLKEYSKKEEKWYGFLTDNGIIDNNTRSIIFNLNFMKINNKSIPEKDFVKVLAVYKKIFGYEPESMEHIAEVNLISKLKREDSSLN